MTERAIFEAALDITDPAERAAYLNATCADNTAMRQRLDELLAAQDKLGSFLSQPLAPGQTADYAPISEKPGSMIGPYKLKEQIGEGGFGLVFVAEQQEPVKRKVALKVIKPGMDTREVMARFTAERQALALMDHPNIARVLDAGATDSGRPYFVMELVRGIPITDYCDQNQLSPRDRLDLFITVCQAVQHAHQKGIIHRDIKPSNVLVTSHDGKPVAKVIDFGIAKAINQQLTERSIYTNFSQMIGTPLYMSPEQAEMSGLDIDTRSDIYSLGVLLYELLTGTTPLDKKRFAKAAYDEIRRMIREDEPQKPSTRLSTSESIASIAAQRHIEPAKLSKLMRGDLDWITMKALEKDRTRRYETANGLARDIQRYLSDEPVEACPPSATYRLRKFAKKNRAALTTATAIALLLVAGVAVSTWQAIRANRAEQVAMAAREAEAAQRQLAETSATQARAAAEAEKKSKEAAQTREAETKAVLDFVENKVFAAARPKDQQGGQGYEVKLADAITAALPYVEKSFTDQPLIEARLRMTLGQSFQYLGKSDVAEQQYRRARDLFKTKLGPDHPVTLGSMLGLANSYRALGRDLEALALGEETLKLMKAKLGSDHPYTLKSMNNLAISYAHLGRHREALALHQETLKLMKAKHGPDHPDTLICMAGLANSYTALGQRSEALTLNDETLKLRKAKLGPDHPSTLESMNSLANSYAVLGRHSEALTLNDETLKLRKAKLGPDHPSTLTSMQNLATSYDTIGRHPEALTLREETLKLRKAKLGPDHPSTLESMNSLANSYAVLGRHSEALTLNDETLKLRKAKLGPDHPDTLASMSSLANSYFANGRHPEALALREETLKLQKTKLGSDHPDTLASMMSLANSYNALGQHNEALTFYEETLKLSKAKQGSDHPNTLKIMNNLAISYAALGRHSEALALREETLKLTKAKFGPDHPSTLASMQNLASSYDALSRNPEALALREETLKLKKVKLGPDHPDTLSSMMNLANSYNILGRHTEALALHEETLKLQKVKLGPDHPGTLGSMVNLAESYKALGRLADATKLYEETLAVMRIKIPNHHFTLNCLMGLAGTYAAIGRYPEARALCEEAMKRQTAKFGANHPNTVETMYDLACSHALPIANAEDRGKQADLAMDWLQQAVAAGHKDVANMKKDINFNALREREDFKKLIAELEAQAEKK